MDALQDWLGRVSLFAIAPIFFVSMIAAAAVGTFVHGRRPPRESADDRGQEGYMVSAVLGLLALLLGFTFSLAVGRYEERRLLVLDEANAIGTTYLRTQLLPEPHRARMSDLLVRYAENRIQLAKATPGKSAALIATNDALITDIWAAASAAFDSVKSLPFSVSYLDTVNQVIDLDAARKAARGARIPPEVFVVLFVYSVVTAGVLGYVLQGVRGRVAAAFLMALLTLSLVLIVDIDRPAAGGIIESQRPIELLLDSMRSQPATVYDRWRLPTS